jgi:hypothetical protein
MISDNLLQADIITRIISIVTGSIYASIATGTSDIGGVRELQYQSDLFIYPNIRVDLESNEYVFDEQERCQLQYVEFSVYVFSEQRSSKECSQIKGMLATALVGLGFHGANAKYTRLRLVDNVPAVRESELIWRSQIKLGSRVQNLP